MNFVDTIINGIHVGKDDYDDNEGYLDDPDVEEDMDEFVEQYEENGVKVSCKIGDSEAKITMSMDKLSEEFEDFDGKKYDEVKELLEDSSFKCE